MRIDKFLKLSKLIKRRTVADEACSQGRVKINGKVVKSSALVNEGDVIEIGFGEKQVKAQVVNVLDHVRKDDILINIIQ